MEWVKIDTRIFMHPKMLGLSEREQNAHLRAICWSGAMHTDGRIPPELLRQIRVTTRTVERLVDAGLWEQNGNGWVIHDWGEHQESSEAYEDRRRKWRERKARQRERETTE